MGKLDGSWSSKSWWSVFTPLFVGGGIHIPLLFWILLSVNKRMTQHLGPPPPPSASLTLHGQYQTLRSQGVRSHVIDTTNSLLDSAAMLTVKVVFAFLLDSGKFQSANLRVVFAPIWVVWVLTTILTCCKHRRERVIGGQRDLTYIFLLMVAFKVDGASSFPWQVVFIVPWLWLTGVMLLGVVVAVSLACARVWTRWKELTLPLGFMLLLFCTGVPQFAFARNLVARLEGDLGVSMQAIFIPAIVGWIAMWAASGVLALGLRMRERVRHELLASGAVWTAHEVVARNMQPAAAREEEQRRVDAMSDLEVRTTALQYMQRKGCVAPLTLLRVGPQLYKQPDHATPSPPAPLPTSAPGPGPAGLQRASQPSGSLPPSSPRAPAAAGSATVTAKPGHVTIELVTRTATASPPPPRASPRASDAYDGAGGAAAQLPGEPEAGAVPAPGLACISTARLHEGSALSSAVQGSGESGSNGAGRDGGAGETRRLPALLHQPDALTSTLLGLGSDPGGADDADDGTCVICYEGQAGCVLLGCGHAYCQRCAYLLLVRPPGMCPTCRQPIDQVVELESVPAVGQIAEVVPHARAN